MRQGQPSGSAQSNPCRPSIAQHPAAPPGPYRGTTPQAGDTRSRRRPSDSEACCATQLSPREEGRDGLRHTDGPAHHSPSFCRQQHSPSEPRLLPAGRVGLPELPSDYPAFRSPLGGDHDPDRAPWLGRVPVPSMGSTIIQGSPTDSRSPRGVSCPGCVCPGHECPSQAVGVASRPRRLLSPCWAPRPLAPGLRPPPLLGFLVAASRRCLVDGIAVLRRSGHGLLSCWLSPERGCCGVWNTDSSRSADQRVPAGTASGDRTAGRSRPCR